MSKIFKILSIGQDLLLRTTGLMLLIFLFVRLFLKSYSIIIFLKFTPLNCIFFFLLCIFHVFICFRIVFKLSFSSKNTQINLFFEFITNSFKNLSYFWLQEKPSYATSIKSFGFLVSSIYTRLLAKGTHFQWIVIICLLPKLLNIFFILIDIYIYHKIVTSHLIIIINLLNLIYIFLLHSAMHAMTIIRRRNGHLSDTRVEVFERFHAKFFEYRDQKLRYVNLIYSLFLVIHILIIFVSLFVYETNLILIFYGR